MGTLVFITEESKNRKVEPRNTSFVSEEGGGGIRDGHYTQAEISP